MRLLLFLVLSFYMGSTSASLIAPTLESIIERLEALETELKETKSELKETKASLEYELDEAKAAINKLESNQLKLSASNSLESEVFVTGDNRLDQLNIQPLERMSARSSNKEVFTTSTSTVSPYTNLMDLRSDPCMPPIKNQGNCTRGEWAFAFTTPLEFSYCKNHNGKLILLSEQQLLDCVYGNNGCIRGYPSYTFDYLKNENTWISSSASYPLTSDETGSAGTCKQGDNTGLIISSNWVSGSPSKTPTVSQIIDALNQYGPLLSGMNLTPSIFKSYTGGIYSDPKCKTSSSATTRYFVIVGYGRDNSSELDYWIVRGSFGTGWGINGYMYVPRGVDFCHIERLSKYATAQ